MECGTSDLRCKEVIDVTSGCRYGCPCEALIDPGTGQVTALVIPGRPRLFGLLGREEPMMFPWSSVRQIGEDIILVERKSIKERKS